MHDDSVARDLSNERKRDRAIAIPSGSTRKLETVTGEETEPMEGKITANFSADHDLESRPIDSANAVDNFPLLQPIDAAVSFRFTVVTFSCFTLQLWGSLCTWIFLCFFFIHFYYRLTLRICFTWLQFSR